MAGSVFAALTGRVRQRGLARTAMLVPRRPADYLPRLALILPAVTVVASTVAVLAFVINPKGHGPSGLDPSGQLRASLVLCIGAAVVTVVGVRLIVAASQPAAAADLLAIDDALRAHALHVVAGTGNTVGFVAASAALLQAGQASGHGIARSVLMALGYAALTLGAGASFGFRKASWGVRSKMPA
jgi:hypothetical protein